MTYCCENCFENSEIKTIVKSKNQMGACNFCGSKNVYVCDLDEDDYATHALQEGFTRIVEAYTPMSKSSNLFETESADLLENTLARVKNLFALDNTGISRFLARLLPEKFVETPELFNSKVGIAESADADFLKRYCILGTNRWEDFVKEIKEKNRFHSQIMNEDILGKFLMANGEQLFDRDIDLFRARVWSTDEGFEAQKMFAPPAGIASAGRANPEGISVLYLADSLETALREVRASIHDRVSVGRFRLKDMEKVKIIDLSTIDKGNPFSADDYVQLAINLPHLEKIEEEIARPMRRSDSTLNYLPTQYICDYIKSIGIAGIKYRSTMNEIGMNYAFFDEEKFECIDVKHYQVRIKGYDCMEIS